MGKIFFGIAGEGAGLVARSRALIDTWREQHDVVVYTSGHTLSRLGPHYKDASRIELRAIPDMTWSSLLFWPLSVRRLRLDIQRDQPDYVIGALEPMIQRAAYLEHVPYFPANRVATAPNLSPAAPSAHAAWARNSGLELAL